MIWTLCDTIAVLCQLSYEAILEMVTVTSCVTCYVISNHMSFCYIDDSGNQMYLRVIAQPVLSDYSDVAERCATRSNRRVWFQ